VFCRTEAVLAWVYYVVISQGTVWFYQLSLKDAS
jgi:hypothetical protein